MGEEKRMQGLSEMFDALGHDERMVERGIPLADLECGHGSMPGDAHPRCECFFSYAEALEDVLVAELGKVVDRQRGRGVRGQGGSDLGQGSAHLGQGSRAEGGVSN